MTTSTTINNKEGQTVKTPTLTYNGGRLSDEQTSFHSSLVKRTTDGSMGVTSEYLFEYVAPLLVNNIEHDFRDAGITVGHRTVVAAVLATMPKGVAVKWAQQVLLNGPKPSWSKDKIIQEVTK